MVSMLLATGLIAETKLTEKLKVIKEEDNKYLIEFSVSGKTDVAVAIINEKQIIVRHLAGGVIGNNIKSPAPLSAGLKQSLTWNYLDDFGKVLPTAKYSVRLTVGTKVIHDRFIGGSPYIFGSINSMAVDETGNLYLMAYRGGANQNMDMLRVFTPNGKYQNTLIPFDANLKPNQLKSVALWNEKRKSHMPINRRSQLPEFYPWGAGAKIISASKKAGIVLIKRNSIFKMDSDGGNVTGPFPLWKKSAKLKNPKWNIPQLAVSPDGKYLYIANVAGTKYNPKGKNDIDPNWPQGRVYRKDLTKGNVNPTPFYDLVLPDFNVTKYWLPDAWNKRTAAYALTIDKKGHIYIGDLVNQAIVEVDPNGKLVSSSPVPWPERIHVDDATGDYFAISRTKKPLDGYVSKVLYRISGRDKESKITSTLSLKKWKGLGVSSTLAVNKDKPVLWLAGAKHFLCIGMKDNNFEILDTDFKKDTDAQQDWNRITTDYERNEVYVSNGTNLIYRYDGTTGNGGLLKKDKKTFHGVDVAVAYDGSLYFRTGKSYSGPLGRYSHDLNPIPFASGTNILHKKIYSRYGVGNCEKGLGVGPKGESYINYMYGWNKYFIAGFNADGTKMKGKYLKGQIDKPKPKKKGDITVGTGSAIIGPIPAACGGVKVDLQGNIYVGLRLVPEEYKAITGYEKNIAFNTWTGCIAKFSSDGGTYLNKKQPPTSNKGIKVKGGGKLEGALKLYPGVAPFSGGGYGSGGSSCVCRIPRFDIDRYGRIVYTNGVTNSVVIVDNEGNLITEFGSYGNLDAQNSPDKSAEFDKNYIPMAWPIGAGFTQNHVYVMDAYNKRIVKTSYEYEINETVVLK